MDTAASANFISTRLISPDKRKKGNIELAGEQTYIKTFGSTRLPMITNGVTSTQDFLVTDQLREDVILGHPWLTQERVTINYSLGCLHHGIEKRATTYWLKNQSPTPSSTSNLPTLDQHFPPSHQEPFLELIQEFRDLLNNDCATAVAKTVQHTIRLQKDEPFHIRPYACSEAKKRLIYEQVDEMLANGVIVRSESDYCSPVVMVKKKDGEPRFCTDYRRLNDLTQDEASPLPKIPEALRDFGTATIFSSIDLKSGYWQIPMDPTSRHLTAFATPDGATYEYTVMPFGLKNAPATFQKLMTRVLSGLLGKFVHVYLDDIIVYSHTYDDHIAHLHQVFERLQEHGLRCAPRKCVFGTNELKYLGHVITAEGNEPQKYHLDLIQQATAPTTRKQLQSFLGLTNWLREYIPHFSTIATPMTDLLNTKKPFKWTEQANKAFEELKEALAKPMILHRPHPDLPFILQTDASGTGIAAVLYQMNQDRRQIISYASAHLNPTQQRYHINEQECLAIVWGVKRYRQYLEDKPFTLITDNKALTWLTSMKDTNAKLTRWSLLLQEFSYKLVHCPGEKNELPDYLSRQPSSQSVDPEAEDVSRMLPPRGPSTNEPARLQAIDVPTLADQIRNGQQEDTDCQRDVTRWQQLVADGPQARGDFMFAQLYTVEDNVLYRQGKYGRQLVVPEEMKQHVIHEFHDSIYAGHPGWEETFRSIQQQFTWKNSKRDVQDYVRACLICACTKRGAPQRKNPLRPHVPRGPWETIALDYIGPMEVTPGNNRFIFVVTDMFTRWVEAFPVPQSTAEITIKLLENEIFSRYGYPYAILSDNGSQFTSVKFEQACRKWCTRRWTTAVYHPRANPTERRNQEIKKGLRVQREKFPGQSWDIHLPAVLFSLRRRLNHATGTTPSDLLLGFELPTPGSWDAPRNIPVPQNRRAKIAIARENQARYHNRYAQQLPTVAEYNVGDLVLVRNHNKGITKRWMGPYAVLLDAGDSCYWVNAERRPLKYHIDDIRPTPPNRPVADDDHPDDDHPDDDNSDDDHPVDDNSGDDPVNNYPVNNSPVNNSPEPDQDIHGADLSDGDNPSDHQNSDNLEFPVNQDAEVTPGPPVSQQGHLANEASSSQEYHLPSSIFIGSVDGECPSYSDADLARLHRRHIERKKRTIQPAISTGPTQPSSSNTLEATVDINAQSTPGPGASRPPRVFFRRLQ